MAWTDSDAKNDVQKEKDEIFTCFKVYPLASREEIVEKSSSEVQERCEQQKSLERAH